jgi:uncharacterized protein (TIGR00266 family)
VQIELLQKPEVALARVALDHGESIVAQRMSLAATTPNVTLAKRGEGLIGRIGRLLAGDDFAPETITAGPGRAEILLAPALTGDATVLDVGPGSWLVASSAFVFATSAVDLKVRGGALSSFFSGAGLFVIEASGVGKLAVGSFGALSPLQIDGTAVVDTGHLVAWETSLTSRPHDGDVGLVTSWLAGESASCSFEGTGTVWLQSRNLSELGARIGARLPPRGG